MKNLVDRIAGVGFTLALTLSDDSVVASDYTWSLRGKSFEAATEDDPVVIDLSSTAGDITVVDGEVVCSFSPAATEGLAGLYRLQLIGYAGGQAVLGGEPEPLRFVPRF